MLLLGVSAPERREAASARRISELAVGRPVKFVLLIHSLQLGQHAFPRGKCGVSG